MEILYGIHAVSEAVRSHPENISAVTVARERRDGRMEEIIAACRAAKIPVKLETQKALDRMAGGARHQGVVATLKARSYSELDDIVSHRRAKFAFVLALDGIEDPHNLGAILRTAEGAGADGAIIPERRAAGVNGAVAKAAAGALEHLRVARVTNLGRALEQLKQNNIWTVGLDERGAQSYDQLDYKMDCALVLGAEGHGLHQHIRERCDFLVRISMLGKVPSLNVSVAAGVVMYEVVRQRRGTS